MLRVNVEQCKFILFHIKPCKCKNKYINMVLYGYVKQCKCNMESKS
jgi:hypothetical protein